MPGPALRIRGIREFSRTLRDIDLADDLKQAHYDVASAVVDRAGQIGSGLGGVHAHVIRAGSIKASRRAGSVSINLTKGGRAGPTFGAEFGAKAFRQFPSWKGNQEDGGYMVHEAIRRMTDSGELVDTYERRVFDEVLAKAFPD